MAKELSSAQVPRLGYVTDTEPKLIKPAKQLAWNKKVRQMRRDPTVSLVRRLIIAPALASSISVEAEDNAPMGAAELIERVISPMRVHIIDNAFRGCIDFGWQPFELVFDVDELGDMVIRKMKPLLQDHTEILVDKQTGAYAGLQQGEGDNAIEFPIENTFVHNWDVEGTDWYGEALMRCVEGPYDEDNTVKSSATRYDDKIAGSHWVIHYPPGTTVVNNVEKDNWEVAKELLDAMRANGSITIPTTVDPSIPNLVQDNKPAWRVELITDGGATSTSFVQRRQYLDALKARAFGVPERSVLEGQFGTKAEAEAHSDMAIVIIEMRNNMLWQGVNWHIVNRMLRLNYGPQAENTVYVRPAPLTDTQRAFYKSIYDKVLASPDGFAVELDEIDLQEVREKIGIPTKTQEQQSADSPSVDGTLQDIFSRFAPQLLPSVNGNGAA